MIINLAVITIYSVNIHPSKLINSVFVNLALLFIEIDTIRKFYLVDGTFIHIFIING